MSVLPARLARPESPAAPREPSGTEPAIALQNVSKWFGPVQALDSITIDVARGEFLCLIGASGCGKSTLLNLIAGLDRATGGSVAVHSKRPTLLFQEAALFPWLTARGNVELALKLRKVPRQERRAEAERLLATVRLEGFEHRRPHELSGGMRQRVALARALAQQPELLLMDEPFGALDAMTRDVLHDELERLWQETALTVVFVTHNVREAVRLGDRVVLLSSRPGRVVDEQGIDVARPRRIESHDVADRASTLTDRLREEVRRHGDE
ncbi:MAG: ABC transporter ATP-binding protein [Actinobacteria bacterium]|nr:ABC transporter ATP-binding protein [Actinomycetota bacterium]